tara:strand:- start:705 stop:1502 length:798 start_codon:yes stop_codon:yes gene_type:complete
MSVVEDSNKQMLFDLLKSIGNDNKLVINDNSLYNFINQRCGYFHTNRYEFGFGTDLNKTNKKIIDEGYNFIMSNQPRKNVQQDKQPANNENIMTKREMFEKGLEHQEKQFNKMINPKKPKEIDFSDAGEDFPIQNLDQIINQTLADRQKELENITQKYSSNDKKKAEQWLNRDDESTPKIKIEKNSNLKLDNAINVSNKKRVHFEVKEKEQEKDVPLGLNNLFSKLKQKPKSLPQNDNIINKLDTIILNQEKILEMLYNKSMKES